MKLTEEIVQQLFEVLPQAQMICQDLDGDAFWVDGTLATYIADSYWQIDDEARCEGLGVYELAETTPRIFRKEPSPAELFPRGTKVLVCDYKDDFRLHRYSAGTVDSMGRLECLADGQDEWTTGGRIEVWQFVKAYDPDSEE